MKNIFRNLLHHWRAVLCIILLLVVQAFCDLSLPTFTSDLIDVGIQNGGIEYATPTVMREETYEALTGILSLTEGEDAANNWHDAYTVTDGKAVLNDTSAKAMEEMDATYTKPLVFYSMMLQAQENAGDSITDGTAQTADAVQSTDEAAARAAMAQMITSAYEEADAQLSSMGDSLLHSTAVAFTKAEYEAIGEDLNHMQTMYLVKSGGKMLALALLMAAVAILISLLASRVSAAIGRDLREKVFGRVVRFSNEEINHFSTASLITRSTNDVQQIQMVSMFLLRMIFYAPIIGAGGILMAMRTKANMEWIIGLAVFAIICLVSVLMVVAMPKFKLMQKLVDRVNLVAREILTGLNVIRAFQREEREEERFEEANKNLTKTMLFTNRVMTFMMPFMMLIMNGISVLIIWVAAHRIDLGTLEVGAMTAFISYTMQIVMAFLMICMVSIMLPRAAVAADRIEEVITTEPVIVDQPQAKELHNPKGVLAFDHVSFCYPGAEQNSLHDISFVAKPGTTTAIVGSTGSGKSTLVQLIPRFFDVTEGHVSIDGTDIRDLTQQSLREAIGYVPQKGVLFSGTIKSNILFGAPNADDAQMEKAARIAQATEFIEAKTDRYDDAIAQGGTNVSGGQKQRLSIARAIARDPKIYVFDDSFSALDFKTDAALRKALHQETKDATVIIVAQRISTVLHADQIIVLNEGEMVGKGTHSELMRTCETYEQIARSQLSEAELAENEISISGKEVLA